MKTLCNWYVGLVGLWLLSVSALAGAGGAIDAHALSQRIESGTAPFILDVRTKQEFDEGHVPGAVHIPHDELVDRLDELNTGPSDEIVVYCRSGRRAAMAQEVLRERGYSQVRDLTGHWQGWPHKDQSQ